MIEARFTKSLRQLEALVPTPFRRRLFAFASIFFVILFWNLLLFASVPSTSLSSFRHQTRTYNVALLESTSAHDEVIAAFVYPMMQIPGVDFKHYLKAQRFDIGEVYNTFPMHKSSKLSIHPIEEVTELVDAQVDLVILATCEVDIKWQDETLKRLLEESPSTQLVCILHHADKWDKDSYLQPYTKPWIESDRVTMLVLSPHVKTHLEVNLVPKWTGYTKEPRIEVFPPVFPFTKSASDGGAHVQQKEAAFTLQGDFSSKRRDYGGVLSTLGALIHSPKLAEEDEKLTLHLLGQGKPPTIPDNVVDNVKIDQKLNYTDFYSILSDSFAVLTAFGEETYFSEKASSSVPASIISGCPLIADQRTLETYRYLDDDMVWIKAAGEDDMDVIARIVTNVGAEERQLKKEKVKLRNAELCEGNMKTVKRWLEQSKEKAALLSQ
ncbi:hypothetical protein YB2330_003576 [Saitoella coloradoensis]